MDHPLLTGLRRDEMTVVGLVGPRDGPHQVLSFRSSNDGIIGPLGRYETTSSSDDLAATIEGLRAVEHTPPTENDPIDLLVCTHGTRDRCCGHSGTLLHVEVVAAAPEGVRVWRACHLGGHRFAPTTLTLPDGLSWGFVDADLQLGLLDRSAGTTLASRHLRGHIGAGNRRAQAADVALFAERGWPWLAAPRFATTDEAGDGLGIVNLIQDSTGVAQRVRVSEREPIAIPPCGEPIEASTKSFVPLDAQPVRPGD